MFAGVGGIGTITREGGGCRDDTVVDDAEKEDGEAYGGDSDDVCDWTSGDDTVGEGRFDIDLAGHVASLPLSLIVGLSSLEPVRRTLPLAKDTDLTADAVVDPEGDGTKLLEESTPKLATAPLSDVDDGTGGIVRVRVEDSLDDGEPEEGTLACCDNSEDVRERVGRGG